jgi:phosphatidylserine/phosphatidylglycerophosphate/cardiolipin synthase-like enzyme
MTARASLKQVSTQVLEQLRTAIASGAIKPPVDRASLVGFGIRHQLEAIEHALAGHKSPACLSILETTLSEREVRRPTPELVWTGPEAPAGAARDTAIVLRELFESARESVILAGYSFDHAHSVLAPLHSSMRSHGVEARFFVDVPQAQHADVEESYLTRHLGAFLTENWPFGEPRPRIYYDKRALRPGPPFCSLHAKCVVIDGAKAFVSSANFTQRGQERNIEVGVLVEDASFASFLAGQWQGLIEAGIVGEYRGAVTKAPAPGAA